MGQVIKPDIISWVWYNMLKYTKASIYPMVSVTFAIEQKVENSFKMSLTIDFAGKQKTYNNIEVAIEKISETEFSANGEIPLLLSDFEIERPSLLMISVDDLTPVAFKTTWMLKNSF